MRPTTAFDNVFDFDALLHPGKAFDHPKDVVAHPFLSIGEKGAILASWASDASAIASCPALRAPPGLRVAVTIDEILEAWRELDGAPRNPPGASPTASGPQHVRLQPRSQPMIDENFSQMRAHRNNIARYRKLLETSLTDLERQFLERRLSEEQSALEKIAASTFPLTFTRSASPTTIGGS